MIPTDAQRFAHIDEDQTYRLGQHKEIKVATVDIEKALSNIKILSMGGFNFQSALEVCDLIRHLEERIKELEAK